ncbi:MAG: glycosyltransferase family 8 protein [Acidimicrobiales bacterium]|nr:MAG: glycosyltransferase family 8 protein [Acidimicrobiales bacterium]
MIMPSPHHVIVATDENFAMPTSVALRSLLLHGGGPFAISVLHNGISLDAIDNIIASLPDRDFTISWHDMSDFSVGASAFSHLPDAACFRLHVADLVPASTSRVVYLDGDVLVRRDLSHLFTVDLEGAVFGAVRSVNFPSIATRGAVDGWRELGLDPRSHYFNSGVLVVDTDEWRNTNVKAKAIDYLLSGRCGPCLDQEALNVTTSEQWFALEPTFNQQTPLLDDQHGAHLLYPASVIEAARTDPHIVHFQDRPKPWHKGCTHPWQDEWLAVAAGTRFTDHADLPQRGLRSELHWRTRRAASALIKGR